MKKFLLISLFLSLSSVWANAQCDYVNGDFEEWDTSSLTLGPFTRDVILPSNHISLLRLAIFVDAIIAGNFYPVQLFGDDPQLFFGIDQSTDANSGEYAVKLQVDSVLNIADIWTNFPCDTIEDTLWIDIKHVGNSSDTLLIYGAYDENVAPLPESQPALDTLAAYFLGQLVLDSTTDYSTYFLNVINNNNSVPVDTFSFWALSTVSVNSYFLIDNIRLNTQVDEDNDGFNADVDCDDNNPDVNPGATEICDGIDNDCNGDVDEGLTFQDYYDDGDGDGYGAGAPINDCQSPGPGFVLQNGDCDDTNAAVNPGATETCDGIDNDCNGDVDDGLTFQDYYADSDGDGYGTGAAVNDCQSPGVGYVLQSGDCDDGNANVNPGATETCDGVDNDCNGEIDDNVTNQDYFLDSDGDGYGAGTAVSDCQSPGANYVLQSGDCDDTNANINPGAAEICDGLDNDCNGNADDGITFQDYYADGDGDGYGAGAAVNDCQSPGADYVLQSGDCDDGNANINPGALESCNGIDDNCDTQVDEGVLVTFYLDSDGDGYGNAGTSLQDCTAPTNYVDNADDCNDSDANVNPAAAETCDGIDNDCNGMMDDGLIFQDYYLDGDADGYGAGSAVNDCQSPGAGYVLQTGDCNDGDANVNPGATETCNSIDDNCDGEVDEGVLTTYYLDSDGDGYGDEGMTIEDCSQPMNYVTSSNDCDDSNASVSPEATETCNAIDDNCDGQVDEGVQNTYYLDSDGDGFGDTTMFVQDCSLPTGYADNASDCDDSNAGINPDATEIPANGIDEDCDGIDDPSATDELSELGIRVFPNPVSNELFLENVPPVGYQVELLNNLGQNVIGGQLHDHSHINTQHLPSGIYFVKITEEISSRRKVVLVVKE